MPSHKLVRRVLLAAAVCQAPIFDQWNEFALATNGPVPYPGQRANFPQAAPITQPVYRPAVLVDQYGRPLAGNAGQPNRIQPVQYQPAQQQPMQQPASSYAGRNQAAGNQQSPIPPQSGNPSVVNELNRLFIENGQQPPSMRDQDLPYANSPRPNTIRAKEQAPKKPNVLQKFVSRITGRDAQKKPIDTPVPNDTGLSSLSAPPPAHAAAHDNAPGTARMRPLGASTTASVPPQPGTMQSRPAAAANTNRPQTSVAGQPQQRAYVQPGPAPAFMQPYPTAQQPALAAPPTQAQPQQKFSAVPVTRTTPQAIPQNNLSAVSQAPANRRLPVDDDFVDPFAASAERNDADEVLDLDALIEIPKPAETSVPAAMPSQAPEPAKAETAVRAAETAAVPVEENPFTGVRLNVSDDQYFDDTTGRAALDESDAGMLSENLPPVEEFDADLPGLPLTATDEAPKPTAIAQPLPAGNVTILRTQPDPPVIDNERLQQAAELQRRERQRTLILSRSSQTGFKGFCPVHLRDQRELVDADPAFTATFGLKSYSFSSREAKAAFEADPSRYAPAAGGSDVVLLVNGGEEQSGMLDYSLWYRDRLYMFRSRETMALFSNDPARYANQY